jgi:glycosyltransferase involved in cell wall biosynthesis
LRILFTMTGSWGTGSGTVIEALSAGLAKRGHEVAVLHPENAGTPADPAPRAPEARHEVWPFPIRAAAVELPCFPLMIPDPNPRAPEDAWTYAAMTADQRELFVRSFQHRLREVVLDFRPDVIECQHVWLMPWAILQMGLPYCVASHHSDQMAFEQDRATRPFAVEAARGAWRIFALMDGNRHEVIEQTGVDAERVVVMGNGFDREVFRPAAVDRGALLAQHALEIPDDVPIVTFAGKLSRTKGIDILLEANGLLRDRMSVPPAFVIFGSGRLESTLDPSRNAARTYVRAGCHFLGHQPYEVVRDFHNVAHHSVMPSRTEGFGLAALEAMGCALPVVVTRLGGPDTYSVGPVIEPGDAVGLADSIQGLLEMEAPAHAALCAEALRVARTFSWDEIVERRLAEYAGAPAMPARDW